MTSVGIHSRNSAFKVPLPRRHKQEQSKPNGEQEKSENPAEIDSHKYDASFLQIVHKFYTDPGLLSDIEMMLIHKHPVIGQVIEQAAKFNVSISKFYVPVESILDPYASDKVQIYFRPQIQIVLDGPNDTQDDINNSKFLIDQFNIDFDENSLVCSTTISLNSETTSEPSSDDIKIGFYTKKERMDKIKKYKAKKQRAIDNLANRKIKYANKSAAARRRLRVKGKFIPG